MIETRPDNASRFTVIEAEMKVYQVLAEHKGCSAIIVGRKTKQHGAHHLIRVDNDRGKTLGYYITQSDANRRGTLLLNKALGWF